MNQKDSTQSSLLLTTLPQLQLQLIAVSSSIVMCVFVNEFMLTCRGAITA